MIKPNKVWIQTHNFIYIQFYYTSVKIFPIYRSGDKILAIFTFPK